MTVMLPTPIFLNRRDKLTKTSAEMLELAKKIATEEFWKKGKLSGAIFVFDNPPGDCTSSMLVGWRENREKHAVADAARNALRAIGAIRYAVIVEMWFLMQHTENGQSVGKLYKEMTANDMTPSQHPDRQEGVIVVVHDDTDQPLSALFDIKRRVNSRPVLALREQTDNFGQMIDMTFGNLHRETKH